LTDAAPLNPGRYVMRQIRSRPTRSGLIVGGVAIAVAFFVLFAAMSVGLNGFIDEELARPRTTHIFLDSGSPTPFSPEQVGLVELVASRSEDDTGVPHHVTPRAQLQVSSTPRESPLRLWGVSILPSGVVSPPYDTDAILLAGRHLEPTDEVNESQAIPVVVGNEFGRFTNPITYDKIDSHPVFTTVRPGNDVDPWRMPDAEDYPLEGRASVQSTPRGPVMCEIVGVLEPGQGDDLDWGAFVPLDPLMGLLGQRDDTRNKTYYPQVVVTVEDASRVDIVDLEETLVETVPGIQGTDDHWDPEEFKATYGGAVGALDGWLLVITAVLVVMLVAGVSDTTLVAVTDRRREIATLRALGIGRRQVARLVLTEVAALAIVGLALGLVLGSVLALLFGHLHDTTGGSGVFLAPTSLDPLVLVAAAVLALGSAAVAAAYPASRAAGQPPTEALRYE
jgi:hypothetical protein